MPNEIELKLRIPPTQARFLIHHPVLAAIKPQRNRLFNTYYDTSDLDLHRRGIALRLRRKGWAVWLMTVKGGESGAGGLAQRREWEVPTQPGVFDFSIVTDSELHEWLESLKPRLLPVFTTDFTRTSWMLHRSGAVIELALDNGKVSATTLAGLKSTVSERISEVELELVEGGSTDPLFELAIELAGDIHLHPEVLSKAERGYILSSASVPRPAKSFVSPVTAEMSPVEAFRSIALSCLMLLQRNEEGAVTGANPEFVHQARVAIRRLRSAFRLFAPVLSSHFVQVYSPRWKELATNLGGARDWDVFLAETLTLLEEAFPGNADLALLRVKAEAEKQRAGASASVNLTQREYSRLLLAFSAALFRQQAPTIETPGEAAALKLRRFASNRLQKRTDSIRKLVQEHGRMNAERRHELRIEFKKLRYALEFFAPILPQRRLKDYLSMLAKIQELLGALNDQVTAMRLIKEIHPESKPDSLISGWIAGRNQLLLLSFTREIKRFLASDRPW